MSAEKMDTRPLAARMRPETLDEFVGQAQLLAPGRPLRRMIEADAVPSMIFWGPPGVGKTTLANIIAHRTNANFVNFSAVTGSVKDIRAVMQEAEAGSLLHSRTIVFVDEIHRLNKQVEEVLYPAMEDFAIDIMIGKGSAAKSIRLELPRFTLVGATTRAGLLSAPLRARFGMIQRLEFYPVDELKQIILNSAKKLGVSVEENGAVEMAKRSRGTPRLANRILKRVRDYAQVRFDGVVTEEVAKTALDLMDVDKMGLDRSDRRILLTLIQNFGGGPAGLDTLAAAIGEDAGTIEDVVEPYLLQNGLLNRTPRGRVATRAAYEHLGLSFPECEEG